ncbi:oxidoreductase [Streptomyces sp. SID8111]|uniref:FAD-dependent oxidoreductase n=1 Tax=Streptomyces sp. SID8111 TaxID=2706100 RepID=UPI0013C0996D|nr:oxidoreductase [Streptomyces sp. SID8111]
MAERIVVVGASLAGLRAVETARRSGFTGEVVLVGAEEHLPYDRPPLSKAFLTGGGNGRRSPEPFRTREQLAELGVELRLGRRALGLDAANRTVVLDDGGLPFDRAVIATGAYARPLPGAPDDDRIHLLRTWDDAVRLSSRLRPGARVLVVGAGFIGSEIASSALSLGCEVTVVEAGQWPLERALGAEMGLACVELHRRAGVTVHLGTGVQGIEPHDDGLTARLSTGVRLTVDLVVVGIGAAPATDWLDGSGVVVEDGAVCDATLETAVPGVFAAGDVARRHDPVSGRSVRLENWTNAAEQGVLAGRRAAGLTGSPYAPVSYFWSDWHGTRIQMLGTSDADEAVVLDGDPADGAWVAGYRRGDQVVGVLAVARPAEIMKYRRLVAGRARWADLLAFAKERAARRPALD